jgi:hypothetical protein
MIDFLDSNPFKLRAAKSIMTIFFAALLIYVASLNKNVRQYKAIYLGVVGLLVLNDLFYVGVEVYFSLS